MEELRLEFDEMRTQWQDDHDELQLLRAAPPTPTVVVQRERKLRRYSGLDEPALEDWIVYGEKETANQLLRRFFFRRQMAGEPISAYSHGLVEIANRINRLVPKPDEERDSMLRDQFVENLRDAHLHWKLKRRIETDEDIDGRNGKDVGRVGLPTAPTNRRTGGARQSPDGGARPTTSVDGVNNCHVSSVWPTSCPTPSSGGHCVLRL